MALTDEDKTWMLTHLERIETSLLTEFHKMRQRSHTATLRALDLELESVSAYVEKPERRPS
jgi:hypothetical protein